jgi:hypothetical protein
MSSSNSSYINECFEKSIDAEFLISKRSYNPKIRDIELISSLFSLEYANFTFEFNEGERCFELVSRVGNDSSINSQPLFEIVLASESLELIGVFKYLFNRDFFDLKIIRSSLTEIIQATNSRPHIIIFNPLENQTESEFKKIGSIITNSEKKAIFISSQSFIRNQDRSKILKQGFSYALGKNFYIEELIISIEMMIDYSFYNEEMEKIPNKNYVVYDLKTFNHFTHSLLNRNIFFSVFKFKYKTPVNEEDLKSSLGRAFDTVYYIRKENVFYLFLVNTLRQHLSSIIWKMKNINKTIEFVDIKESIEFRE